MHIHVNCSDLRDHKRIEIFGTDPISKNLDMFVLKGDGTKAFITVNAQDLLDAAKLALGLTQ